MAPPISPSRQKGVTDLGPAPFFEDFRLLDVAVDDSITIRAAVGGSGPPLLLLHGHPQTHVTWHKVAPVLAKHFTLIAADLRGYGDSSKPPGGAGHEAYSKRAMARDQVALMRHLGHERFRAVGHDRGGRVLHRLALDHPDALERVVVIDIVPTATVYARADMELARRYFWWFLFIQPEPLPERMIGADPEFFLRKHIDGQSKTPGATGPDVFAEYLRCYLDPATRHSICEDYRAAASIDLVHDREDSVARVTAPLLAIWGGRGTVGALYDVLATWREKALHVEGGPLDCGHTLQEERPEETIAALLAFLKA